MTEELESLLKKNLAEKLKYAKDLAQNSAEAEEVLDQWIVWFRDQLLSAMGRGELAVLDEGIFKNIFSPRKISEAIKNISLTQNLIGDGSFNARLILENLMIKL